MGTLGIHQNIPENNECSFYHVLIYFPFECKPQGDKSLITICYTIILQFTSSEQYYVHIIDFSINGPISLKMSTSQRTPKQVQNLSKLLNMVMRIELTRAILMK